MADQYKIKCSECGKQESFVDDKDITYHKWKILGRDISKCEPICLCDKCEFIAPGQKFIKKNENKKDKLVPNIDDDGS